MDVTPAEHYVIGNEGFLQPSNREDDFLFPFFEAKSFDSRNPEEIFDDVALSVGQIAELEREEQVFQNQRGAESGPKSEKKHSITVVTPKRLHRGVVDDVDGVVECVLKIEVDPTLAQMFRIPADLAATDRCRKTDGDAVELPIARCFLEFNDEIGRLHLRSGIEVAVFGAVDHQLHVRAADIDDESLYHRTPGSPAVLLAKADGLTESLENSFSLLPCSGSGRPAFNNFKREKPEQRDAGEF